MLQRDPRLVVGSTVSAKATFVTSKAECCNRYGALQQTKKEKRDYVAGIKGAK
jgi:hypothetical protein